MSDVLFIWGLVSVTVHVLYYIKFTNAHCQCANALQTTWQYIFMKTYILFIIVWTALMLLWNIVQSQPSILRTLVHILTASIFLIGSILFVIATVQYTHLVYKAFPRCECRASVMSSPEQILLYIIHLMRVISIISVILAIGMSVFIIYAANFLSV